MIRALKLLGILLVLAIGAVSADHYFATRGADFDREIWLHYNDNGRCPMVYALQKQLKPGMDRQEVIALLGKPIGSVDERITYGIGFCGILGEDILDFYFDPAGKLMRTEIHYS